MATPTDKALAAAAKEWQAEQRFDKAESEYRTAHRNLCVALAGLDAKQGKASEFSQFCEQYAEDVKTGKVKHRSAEMLRRMRKAGLLDVPQNIVTTVDPRKIVVAAAKALDPKNPMTEEVAINALAASDGLSSEGFSTVLDKLTEQLETLHSAEQVLPPTPRKQIIKHPVSTTDIAAEAEDMLVRDADGEPISDGTTPEERENVTISSAAIKQQVEAVRAEMDATSEHPAQKHLERASAALRKMPPSSDQYDALTVLRMEIDMLCDRKDTVSDEDIKNLLDAESGDEK